MNNNEMKTVPHKKKKKQKSLYAKVYTITVSVFVAILVLGLIILWAYLKDYESSQAKYVAEDFFNKISSSSSVTDTLEKYGLSVTEFEDKDDVSAAYTKITADKELTCSKATSSVDKQLRYVIKADDKTIADFYLKKSDKKSFFGNYQYEVASFNLNSSNTASVVIDAPKSCTVYINGKTVSADYITNKSLEPACAKHLPDGVSAPAYVEYTIKGLFSTPEVTVKYKDGKDAEAELDSNSKTYTVKLENDETLSKTYSDYAIKFAQTYAAYMQDDASMSAVNKYLVSGTDLYESVRTASTHWVTDHSGYAFKNTKAYDFYAYDENTFSCSVSFTQVLHMTGKDDYTDTFDYTIYFKKSVGKYLVYDMASNI